MELILSIGDLILAFFAFFGITSLVLKNNVYIFLSSAFIVGAQTKMLTSFGGRW